MELRRWISLLAIIGVLFHAGWFVRHNAMMVGVAVDNAALAQAFGDICLSNPGSAEVPDVPLPQAPDNARSHCPECLNATGSVAALLPAPAFYITFYSVASDTLVSTAPLAPVDVPLWPPSQGPPAHA